MLILNVHVLVTAATSTFQGLVRRLILYAYCCTMLHQVAGLSSMLGYMAFVEIIRWYIGEAPKKAGQINGNSNGHTVTLNAVTANGTSDNDAAAAAAAASTADLYAQRRKLLQKGEGGHNVGLAVLSALMLLGIARSCLVSGKFTSLHAFVCEPFRVSATRYSKGYMHTYI
jgi:hypothetical protein